MLGDSESHRSLHVSPKPYFTDSLVNLGEGTLDVKVLEFLLIQAAVPAAKIMASIVGCNS